MSKKEHEEEDSLIDLANHMALCDVLRLIEINKDRIMIFHYELGTVEEIDTVCFNGASIQISTTPHVD